MQYCLTIKTENETEYRTHIDAINEAEAFDKLFESNRDGWFMIDTNYRVATFVKVDKIESIIVRCIGK